MLTHASGILDFLLLLRGLAGKARVDKRNPTTVARRPSHQSSEFAAEIQNSLP